MSLTFSLGIVICAKQNFGQILAGKVWKESPCASTANDAVRRETTKGRVKAELSYSYIQCLLMPY